VKLVLLPGLDGTGILFMRFIAALRGEFNALIVSYPRQWVPSYSELEHLVRSAIPETEPFVLLAESFSSPIAIRLAANPPGNMKGVVLCAGFASSPLRGASRLGALAAAPILLQFTPPDAALRWFLIGAKGDPALMALIREALAGVKPKVLASRLRLVLNCDERRNLQRVQLPILFVRPTVDRLIAARVYEEIRTSNPAVQTVEIDGAHLILQTGPEECAERISAFMTESVGA